MSTRGSSLFSRRKRPTSGGYLLVLVMVIIALLGSFVGMEILLQVAALRAGRALDLNNDQLQEHRRLALLSGEACQQAFDNDSGLEGLNRFLSRGLQALPDNPSVLVQAPVQLPSSAVCPYLEFNPQSPALASTSLKRVAGSSVYSYLNDGVVESPVLEFQFSSQTALQSQRLVTCRVRPCAVPLVESGVTCFELPEEIGQSQATALLPGATLAGLGLCPGRDPARVQEGGASGSSLPYFFRLKASRAAAYARLFSQEQLNRLLLDLGAGRSFFVSQLQRENGSGADAFRFATDHFEVNLDQLAERQDQGGCAALIVCDDAAGTELRLSASGSVSDPLVLWVVAGANRPRRLVLGSTLRPVLMIGVNVDLAIEAEAVWSGGLILSSQSKLSGGPVHLAHLACFAGSQTVDLGVCHFDQPLAPSLLRVAPRHMLAVSEGVQP